MPGPLFEDFAPMSNVAEKLGDQTNRQVTDSDIESWALSAVGAVERFIAERNALRERVRSQDRELLFCVSMRNSYRRLANEFVTQLEIVDNLVAETTQLMSVKSRLRIVNLNYRKLESPNTQATHRRTIVKRQQ